MRVTFWGAARTVTGSKHLLTGRSGSVLLDCGLFQGRRAEFEARIHATRTTADLCGVMLADAAHIQIKDAEWLNRRRRGNRGQLVEPLYDLDDVARVLTRFVPHDYEQPFKPVPGLGVTFHDAGHIAGAASVALRWHENGSEGSLVFTGDMGRPGRAILRDPVPLP